VATLIPPRGGAPAPSPRGAGTAARSSAQRRSPGSQKRERLAAGPRPGLGHEVLGWLRAVLDRPLTSYHLVLGAVALLLIVGLMMVLSASSVSAYVNQGDSYYYVKRQAIFLLVGIVGALVVMLMPIGALRTLSWAGIAIAAVLLVLTYTPLGREINGNRNWLYLGSSTFSIQPAEFAKLAMIVWGADVLARKQRLLDQPKHLLVPYLPVSGLLILLVLFQGDAGTAVVMAAIVAGVLWIVGAPLRVLGALAGAGALGVVAIFVSSPVRMRRLAAFLDPSADLGGANDQANAGMYAIASGGWWGVGLGASRQKWGSLPEAHTDFIFAVLGEEFGLFGSLVVLALFLVLGYAGIRIATRCQDPFARYAAGGVTTWFMVQALINLAVVLRLLPIAGVPLPLVSYGGSALIANLLAVGVLLACARREPAAQAVLTRRTGASRPRVSTVVGSRSGRRA
jgi:cell division protein FtsW